MYDCDFLAINSDSAAESTFSAYNLLLLMAGLATATYTFALFAESQNRINYDSRVARTLAGFLVIIMRLFHTNNEDLAIPAEGKKLIAMGPHRTGWEAVAVGAKLKNSPPRFFATDGFNGVPFMEDILKLFQAIIVPSKKPKETAVTTDTADKVKPRSTALTLADEALDNNGCVAIFPQGNFAYKGIEPHKIYNGIADLAVKHKLPIYVVRLDGFWSLENPLIPLFVRNNAYYRSFLSMLHMNNVRTTLCPTIDFHLKPQNAALTDEQKMNEICAQLYAYYRFTEELTPEQIKKIDTEIADKKHLLIWSNKLQQDDHRLKIKELKTEEAVRDDAVLYARR
ncbi:MAG: 1-acyl-sn-glycerol-3-phosphate acyltransferase [Legionella sp.]|nr:MAG: 1-acyl-sn-glycerol-3-phosphate acyltransferase [Legionella sp.]